jgi:hypothetical protein
MKFSPTVSLAMVLAAGMATAAVAQTTTGTATEPKSTISEPKATVAKPTTGPATEMKTTEPKAKSAQMKATQPRVKRTAHLQATHPKRMAQMKATRTAHLRRPIMQAEKLTPDQIKTAQQQLQTAGLYNGPTDGMMDPDTRAALARFQQQNGLQRTERLDRQTLARLNAGQTTGVGSSTSPSGNQTPVQTTAPTSAGGNTTGQPINR